jgi:hypothetical protein
VLEVITLSTGQGDTFVHSAAACVPQEFITLHCKGSSPLSNKVPLQSSKVQHPTVLTRRDASVSNIGMSSRLKSGSSRKKSAPPGVQEGPVNEDSGILRFVGVDSLWTIVCVSDRHHKRVRARARSSILKCQDKDQER